jgi:ABC-type phosphate transport system ATPase subunit
MLRGDNVLSMPVEIARKEIAYVSQKPQTMPGSVWWNLVLPIAYWYPKAGRDEIASRVSDALDVVGLNSRNRDFRRFRASDLSAGEQQKLALARAIATQPKVLLLDEPTANLDNYDQAAIEELIVRLGERLAVCFVTHNNEQARQISTRTTFMHAGTPFVEDSPVNVFSRNDDSPLGRFNAAKQIDDD